jgi:hypothetical protein
MNIVEWLVYGVALDVWASVGGRTLCPEFYASRAIVRRVEKGDMREWPQ